MKKSKLESRASIVNYLYQFELFNKPPNNIEAFESGEFSNQEIKMIENIILNYSRFQKLIEKYLQNNWTWERISPYIRAILIFGSFDFLINDKNLVINELVILTKAYSPGDDYIFVNGILNNLGDYYEKVKAR